MSLRTALMRVGSRRTLRRGTLVLGTFALAFTLWLGLLRARPWLNDPRSFDVVNWELAALPGKWLYALGAPLRDDPATDAPVRAYFALPDRDRPEARALERAVESTIEGRLDAVLQEAGVRSLPGVSAWPPVALELTPPPRMLAVSPRDRIRLVRAQPLTPSIAGPAAAALEDEVEAASPDRSALVVPLGGISTYPAIVTTGASYADTVAVAAHEWVHHRLAFAPLGWWSLVNRESLAINETAADIVGDELAARVLERFGDPTPRASADVPPDRGAQRRRADRDAALRDLRRDVDALLADGRVADAEARMEDARQQLAAGGTPIRRINQAYFAWYGTYAARPDSVDPLGPQLRQLRAATGSLPRFLDVVGRTTSRDAVARALVRLRPLDAPP